MKDKILSLLPQGVATLLFTLFLGMVPSPGFANTPSYQDAVEAFHQKANPKTKNLLTSLIKSETSSDSKKRAGYLLAKWHADNEDYKKAADLLRKALLDLPELEDYIRFELAEALFKAKQNESALEHVNTLLAKFPDSRLYPRTVLLKAEVLQSLKKMEQALTTLEEGETHLTGELEDKNLDDWVPELIFEQAQLHQASQVPSRAYLLYRKLYTQYPDHDLAQRATVSMRNLASTMSVPPLTEDEFSDRLTVLLKQTRNEQVIKELDQYKKHWENGVMPDRFYFHLASAYRGLRQRSKAIEVLKEFLKTYPLHPRTQSARFKIGRNLWNVGKDEEALHYFRMIRNSTLRKKWIVRAHYFMGRIYEDRKRFDEALSQYEALAEQRASNLNSHKGTWRLGWVYFQMGKLQKAFDRFKENYRQFPESLLADRNLFWQAKTAEALQKPDIARQVYRDLEKQFPFTYYGLRSRQKLSQESFPSPTASVRKTGLQPESPDRVKLDRDLTIKEQFHYSRAQILSDIGFYEEAGWEIEELARSVRKTLTGVLWLSDLYIQAQSYSKALRLLFLYRDFKTQAREKELPVRFWQHFYPRAYSEYIDSTANEYQVDSLFVNSLIRQESLFDTRSLSPAGARGLMQIMPETGRRLFSPNERFAQYDKDALFQPELNIALGIKYLSRLSKKYDHNGVHMLISYNAGPHVLEKWLKRFRHLKDEDVFIESVPYPETRGYIKRVMRNYGIYKRLYTEAAALPAKNKAF